MPWLGWRCGPCRAATDHHREATASRPLAVARSRGAKLIFDCRGLLPTNTASRSWVVDYPVPYGEAG